MWWVWELQVYRKLALRSCLLFSGSFPMSLVIAVPTPPLPPGWKIISLITTTGGRYYYLQFRRENKDTEGSDLCHDPPPQKKYHVIWFLNYYESARLSVADFIKF